jgi:hypothetical protein
MGELQPLTGDASVFSDLPRADRGTFPKLCPVDVLLGFLNI